MNYFVVNGIIDKTIIDFSTENSVKPLFIEPNSNKKLPSTPDHLSVLHSYKRAFFSDYNFKNMLNYTNHDNIVVCCDTENVKSDLLFYFYWNHIFNKKILPNEIVFQKVVVNPGIGARLTNLDFSLFGCRVPMFLKLTSIIDQHSFYRKFQESNNNIEDFDKFDNRMFNNFFVHQYLLKIAAQITANEKY